MKQSPQRGFTLIELLIVIGLLGILSSVVVLVLNPAELLRQARDSRRLSDSQTLGRAIQLYEFGVISKGPDYDGPLNDQTCSLETNPTLYVSVPSDNSETPPTPPTGWTYNQVTASVLRNITGDGWLPIDFTATDDQTSPALAALPIDPINSFSQGLYYTYVCGSYELNLRFESQKHQEKHTSDQGDDPNVYEVGSSLFLAAVQTFPTGGDNPPVVSITGPLPGATVSGTAQSIIADATDDNAVTQVEFFVDTISIGIDTNGADGWSITWDTTTATNGSHSLTAEATDDALQTTLSTAITVTVDNSGGGATAPDIYEWGFEGADDTTASGDITDGSLQPIIPNSIWERDTTVFIGGSQSIRLTPTGNSDSGPHPFYFLGTSVERLFVSDKMFFEDTWNWDGPSSNAKLFKMWKPGFDGGALLSFNAAVGGTNNLRLFFDRWGAIPIEPNMNLPAPTPNDLKGAWHTYEVELDLRNAPTSFTANVWIDGVQYWNYVQADIGEDPTIGIVGLGPAITDDNAGNSAYLDNVSFGTNGPFTTDTTAPTVSITNPLEGAPVSGTTQAIEADAADPESGVSQVEFFVDSVSIGTDTTAPYSVTWDTTTATDGSHSLTAEAMNGIGLTTLSTAITVTVDNSGGGATAPDIYEWGFEGADDTTASGDLVSGGVQPFIPNTPWQRDATIFQSGSQGVRQDYRQTTYDITNIQVGNPTIITAPGSNIPPGQFLRIFNVSGNTPDINGQWTATKIDADTFSIPVETTTAGTGGKFNFNTGTAFYYLLPTSQPSLYVRWYYRQSVDADNMWTGGEGGAWKVLRFAKPSFGPVLWSAIWNPDGSNKFGMHGEKFNPVTFNPNVNLPAPTPNAFRGEWHCYEMFLDASVNPIKAKLWIDDVQYHDHEVAVDPEPGDVVGGVQFDGTINSLDNPSSAWMDNAAISTQRIGCS